MKSFPKSIFEDDYRTIRDSIQFLFRTKDVDKLEKGKLKLGDDFGNEKEVYQDAMEALRDLREIPIGIGEIFYDRFTFAGHTVKVRDMIDRRTEVEDWSNIRNRLNHFASHVKGRHKGSRVIVEKCEEIQKALQRMNIVLANISMDISPR